jgi:hypothetical protein
MQPYWQTVQRPVRFLALLYMTWWWPSVVETCGETSANKRYYNTSILTGFTRSSEFVLTANTNIWQHTQFVCVCMYVCMQRLLPYLRVVAATTCDEVASQRGKEPLKMGAIESALSTAVVRQRLLKLNWEGMVRATVSYKVCELVTELYFSAVTSFNTPVGAITNPKLAPCPYTRDNISQLNKQGFI